MVQSGRDSPTNEVRDTNSSSSPRWDIRPPKARRKLKRSATPHPGKVEGNTKRNALVSLPEKIVFELEELAVRITKRNAPREEEELARRPVIEREAGG